LPLGCWQHQILVCVCVCVCVCVRECVRACVRACVMHMHVPGLVSMGLQGGEWGKAGALMSQPVQPTTLSGCAVIVAVLCPA
jgi:hypothetical protein